MTSQARGFALALAVVLVACLARTADSRQSAPGDWHELHASITASGRRTVLVVEGDRAAVTLHLTGRLVVRQSGTLDRGYRAEFLGFDDGTGLGTARAVWTDDDGDRIFSRMVGAQLEAGRRTSATITGGTGRYAGITGTYSFTWQYLLPGEQDVVQVRVVEVEGRYRVEPPK